MTGCKMMIASVYLANESWYLNNNNNILALTTTMNFVLPFVTFLKLLAKYRMKALFIN